MSMDSLNLSSSLSILSIDPGDHTGWCYYNDALDPAEMLVGGTLPKDYLVYSQLIGKFASNLDIVLLESFHLFGAQAKTMTNNTFYTCEVIGIIKYLCAVNDIKLKLQQPSNKKYTNKTTCDTLFKLCKAELSIPIHEHFQKTRVKGVSEHTRDSILHLVHYLQHSCSTN